VVLFPGNMKICVFTHTFPRFKGDNVAPFMGELAEGLSSGGNKVTVLTPFSNGFKKTSNLSFKLVKYKYIFPEKLHLLGYSQTLDNDKRLSMVMFLLSPFLYLFGFLALIRLVKKEKFDVISSHWVVPNGFICSLVSFFTGVPYTVTIPGSDVYMGSQNFFFKFLVGIGAMNSDWLISDSKFYIKQLNNLGFKPNNLSIIRYGVNSSKFKIEKKDLNLLNKLGIKRSDKVVMALGRFVEKKGFVYFIDSMPQIIKLFKNVKFVIVGDGDQKKLFEEKVKKYKIQKSVIFPGMIAFPDLHKFYNLADVFVMPSIKDNSGNIDASPVSMMEAMMCGVPVVATKFAGGEEVIMNNETGFIVPQKNSKLISKFVLKLLRVGNMSIMRKKVREIAIRELSIKASTRSYMNIFNKIYAKV